MMDALDVHGAIVTGGLMSLAVFYLIVGGPELPVLILLSLASVALFSHWTLLCGDRWLSPGRRVVLRGVFVLAMTVSPALMHESTGVAVTATLTTRTTCDPHFLAADTLLLGWLAPHGQIALLCDRSPLLSPEQPLGRVLTEIFQITYMSYYTWGNLLIIYLFYRSVTGRGNHKALETGAEYDELALKHTRPPNFAAWRRVKMMLYGWVSAYILNFVLNFLFPGISPRLYLQDRYTTDFQGLLFTPLFQNAIKTAAGGDAANPKSFGAFPSGHAGLTWLAACAAQRLGLQKYAQIARIAATSMTCAILFLRYHYFVDALSASILVLTGLYMGRLTSWQQMADSQYAAPTSAQNNETELMLGLHNQASTGDK